MAWPTSINFSETNECTAMRERETRHLLPVDRFLPRLRRPADVTTKQKPVGSVVVIGSRRSEPQFRLQLQPQNTCTTFVPPLNFKSIQSRNIQILKIPGRLMKLTIARSISCNFLNQNVQIEYSFRAFFPLSVFDRFVFGFCREFTEMEAEDRLLNWEKQSEKRAVVLELMNGSKERTNWYNNLTQTQTLSKDSKNTNTNKNSEIFFFALFT